MAWIQLELDIIQDFADLHNRWVDKHATEAARCAWLASTKARWRAGNAWRLSYERRYRETHRVECRARVRDWKRRNPEKVKAERKRNAPRAMVRKARWMERLRLEGEAK